MPEAAVPEKRSDWDTVGEFAIEDDELLPFIAQAPTCVLTRLRSDGHPIGAVYGFGVVDGEVYVTSNVHRAAYRALQRDPRVSVVFDTPDVGMVTLIGEVEIIDDWDFIQEFYRRKAPSFFRVRSGEWTEDDYLRMACTKNRRLLRVEVEKTFSLDLRKLNR